MGHLICIICHLNGSFTFYRILLKLITVWLKVQRRQRTTTKGQTQISFVIILSKTISQIKKKKIGVCDAHIERGAWRRLRHTFQFNYILVSRRSQISCYFHCILIRNYRSIKYEWFSQNTNSLSLVHLFTTDCNNRRCYAKKQSTNLLACHAELWVWISTFIAQFFITPFYLNKTVSKNVIDNISNFI